MMWMPVFNYYIESLEIILARLIDPPLDGTQHFTVLSAAKSGFV
jgi:hypothetical protein